MLEQLIIHNIQGRFGVFWILHWYGKYNCWCSIHSQDKSRGNFFETIIFIFFLNVSPICSLKSLNKWSISNVNLFTLFRKSVNWNYLLKWKTDPVKHCVIMYSKLLSTFSPIWMLEISTSEKNISNISRFECIM